MPYVGALLQTGVERVNMNIRSYLNAFQEP